MIFEKMNLRSKPPKIMAILSRLCCLGIWLLFPYTYIDRGLSGLLSVILLLSILSTVYFYIIIYYRTTEEEREYIFATTPITHLLITAIGLGFYIFFWGLVDPSKFDNKS